MVNSPHGWQTIQLLTMKLQLIVTEFFIDESNEPSINLATLVDDITYKDVCHLEIDGTWIEDLKTLMKEENILLDLLHFRQTYFDIEVGYNLPIYPPIPND